MATSEDRPFRPEGGLEEIADFNRQLMDEMYDPCPEDWPDIPVGSPGFDLNHSTGPVFGHPLNCVCGGTGMISKESR